MSPSVRGRAGSAHGGEAAGPADPLGGGERELQEADGLELTGAGEGARVGGLAHAVPPTT